LIALGVSSMNTLVDDIGSFPLPSNIDKKLFDKAYVAARKILINGKNLKSNDFLVKNFCDVIIDSFKKKIETGLDIINYPQHYDIHKQFTEIIQEATNKGTYVVEEEKAIIPEVQIISEEAKKLSEFLGRKILLRVCITGPVELYLKEIGTTGYSDILFMFAQTVRRFAKNSILNSKYIKTEVISLDEPSFGLRDIQVDRDIVLEVMEKTLSFKGTIKQVHLHSVSRVKELLDVRNLNGISLEYAASPRNIDAVSRKLLEKSDKTIRVGIARTDIDAIIAELYEKGITKPRPEQLIESKENIQRRFLAAKAKYGERMPFTGPDCGLGGWPSQETAQLLLKRTVNAVKSTEF